MLGALMPGGDSEHYKVHPFQTTACCKQHLLLASLGIASYHFWVVGQGVNHCPTCYP